MEALLENTYKLTLVLNQKEAEWLHGVMQNPLHNQHPADEAILDAMMRKKFFDATQP